MSSSVRDTDSLVVEAPSPKPFQIVPIAGLPIAAAAIIGVILAILSNAHWAIDFFHVVGGGMWTAIDLFVGLILGPIIGRLSIPARIEFITKFMPKMVILMPTVVTVTLAAGWQLAFSQGYVLTSFYRHSWVEASFVVVGALAIIAIGLLEPANLAVLFELRKPNPNGELIAKLMKRFIYTAGITGVMQIATLIIMTRLATS